MYFFKQKWCSDGGSIDLIQLIVGLMIISIAVIGTLNALVWGYDHLDNQMRHRKAVSIARSYVEYLQGRLHTDFDRNNFRDQYLLAGNVAHPQERLLDVRNPGNVYDDIKCDVSHGPLTAVNLPDTKGTDYWVIRVFVEWKEPNDNSVEPLHKVFFEARMFPDGF
ncbi:MAG: hypothetical protein P9X24_08025 [Candidatus Hatepunaea meridiana]|nr:hypothetical protein [Candidatus Hatepunaea meridiana]